jgi:hypothetical protein
MENNNLVNFNEYEQIFNEVSRLYDTKELITYLNDVLMGDTGFVLTAEAFKYLSKIKNEHECKFLKEGVFSWNDETYTL